MKTETKKIDFKCPRYKDPYQQCPYASCKANRKIHKKTEIRWDLIGPYFIGLIAYLLLMSPFIYTIIARGIAK